VRTNLYAVCKRSARGIAGFLTLGIVISASMAALEMQIEQVTLRNGKSYSVPVKDGMPEAVRNEHLAFTGLGPMYSPSLGFRFVTQFALKEQGPFTVRVTSALAPDKSLLFQCSGPGEVTEYLFSKGSEPSMFTWVQEEQTSWIPFTFTFQNVESKATFEVTQWVRLGRDAKETFRKANIP
jgi:hypothetical protein